MTAPASAVNAKDFDRFTMGERIIDHAATQDERMWATLIHLGGFTVFMIGPLVVLVPLVLWLVKRDQSHFIDDHGKEAVNFQISLWLWLFASGILVFCAIGIVMIPVLFVLSWVYMVWYAIRANAGEYVRYPITIRFIH